VAQGAGAQARASDAYALLESAGRAYHATAALCADFQQTLSVPLLGQERKGAGRLCTKKPGLFAMRFTEPKGDVVLADGTWFWYYTPSTDAKQVIRWREAQTPRGLDFYQEFLDAPRQKYKAVYQGRETVGGRSTDRIKLTPLQAAPYKDADVWLDAQGSLLRQVQLREENGSVRTVTLGATDTKTAPPPGVFTFTPPAGTQVISR
jgi:outer membrane lipoprotein carrier protein